MASEMIEALTQLCQEKHIDELVLLDRLEQSLAKSYEDVLHINTKAGEKARVTISRETGKIYVYKLVPQEDSYDEELDAYTAYDEFDVTPSDTSRIAAQHAKAEINNLVRNAARTQIYKEFSDRLGDMITGTVLQVTNEFTILKIREGVEAELPYFDQRRNENERNERPAGERYAHNQRIKAIIIDVRDPNGNSAPVRGDRSRPSIVVSRTSPELLARLAEQVEARLAHALAGIRRGAGLERAAAQDGRARGAHGPRDREEVLALDRAGPSHDLEVAAADEHAVTAVDDGVLGVELAVRLLERLRDALDALDDVHTLEQERIDARGVSDDADDGLGLADRDVGLEPAPLDPGDELLELLGACGLLDDSDHGEAFRRASARRCADIHVMVARRRTAPVRSRRL